MCLNDLSARRKPRAEERHPDLLADIQSIMEPHSQSEASLRTISNVLNRQDYRLRTVAKTKVQKKQPRPTPSLPTSGG